MARKPEAGAGEPARPEPEGGLFGLGQGKPPESAEERAFSDKLLARALMAAPEPKTTISEAKTLFRLLCIILGRDEARDIWEEIAKRPPGRPPKVNQERREYLCARFDRMKEETGRKLKPDTIVKKLALDLMKEEGGHSPEAKAEDIRRALRARYRKGLVFGMAPKRRRGRPKASGGAPVMTKPRE